MIGNRAEIAIVFCDLVDSTAILSRLGEEAFDELRRDLFEAWRQALESHGGEEVKSQGDGLMVAFGSCCEAVRGAVELQRTTARLDDRQLGASLAVRIGVGFGEATAEEDDWFGTPVVEAARLCSAAPTGGILVADAVRARLLVEAPEEAARLVDAGGRELKGLPGSRQTWSVGWEAERIDAAPVPPPALQRPSGSVLHGRAHELQLLTDAWHRAAAGTVETVLISGEAGSGMSRIAAELAAITSADGALALHGRARPGRDGREAFGEAVRWWVTGAEPDEVRVATLGLREQLATALPSLRVRLGTESEESPAPPPSPEHDGDLAPVDLGLVTLLGRLAERRPLLVVIDDAHHLGPAGAALVVELLLGSDASRVLLVLLERRGVSRGGLDRLREKAAGHSAFTELSLGGLDRAAVRSMLELGTDPDHEATLDVVMAETDGNPSRLVALRRELMRVEWSAPDARRTPLVEQVREAIARVAPYRGLRAYEAEDRDLFYGREVLKDVVLERLGRRPFVLLVGASGSGKSSLVRAGVLPALADGALEGSERWSIEVTSAAQASAALLDGGPEDGPLAARPRLVVLDQLEELFTRWDSPDEREAFLDRLAAVAEGDGAVRVLATLRADFFSQMASSLALSTVLERATVVVPPMSDDELRAAVSGPAAAVGLKLEPGLVDLVVSDVAARPGALPLASHAMYETWRRRRGRTLTVADYREAGGVDGAVARTADELFESLSSEEQLAARRVLLLLVEPGESADDTRRRVARAEVSAAGPHAASVVEQLVAARLLSADGDWVEIAHEALIRAWPRLRSWLDEDREAMVLHRRLTRAAEEWEAAGRDDGELYRAGRLDAAIEWRADHGDELSDLDREFVDASVALREREQAEATARQERDRRNNRRLRVLLGCVATALVAAVVAAIWALTQRNRAEDLTEEAAARAAAAQVGAIAAQEPTTAWLLAAEAFALRDLPETRSALEESLLTDGRLVRRIPVEGDLLIGGLQPATGHLAIVEPDEVVLRDPASGEVVERSTLDGEGALMAVLSADRGTIAVPVAQDSFESSRVTVTDLAGSSEPWSFDAASVVAISVADGAAAALSSLADRVEVYRPDGSTVTLAVQVPLGGSITSADISPTGDRALVAMSTQPDDIVTTSAGVLATPTGPSLLGLYDTRSGALISSLEVDSPVTDVRFAPGGDRAALSLNPNPGLDAGMPTAPDADATRVDPAEVRVIELDGFELTPVGAPGRLAGWVGTQVATHGVGVVTLWNEDLTLAASPPLTGVGSVGWVDGDGTQVHVGSLVDGAATVSVWDLTRPQGLLAGPTARREVGRLVVAGPYLVAEQASRTWSNLGAMVTDGAVATWVIDAATGETLATADGALGGVAGDLVLVDGRLRKLPDLTPVGDRDTSELLRLGSLSPVGDLVVVPAPDRLELRDPRTGDNVRPAVQVELSLMSEVSWSADGSRLLVRDSLTKAAALVDVSTGRLLGGDLDAVARAGAAALSADGERIAFASENGDVTIREVDGWAEPVVIRGGGGALQGLQFVDGSAAGWGELLVSIDASGGVTLADPGNGSRVGDVLPVSVNGASVALDSDGRALLLPTAAGVLRAVLDPGEWSTTACELAGRSLRPEERDRYLVGRDAGACRRDG